MTKSNVSSIAFNPDGSITINMVDGSAGTFVNNNVVPAPLPITEVDVIQGANTIQFFPKSA